MSFKEQKTCHSLDRASFQGYFLLPFNVDKGKIMKKVIILALMFSATSYSDDIWANRDVDNSNVRGGNEAAGSKTIVNAVKNNPSVVMGAVGGAVGSVVGGNLGGQTGAAIGGAIGGAISSCNPGGRK